MEKEVKRVRKPKEVKEEKPIFLKIFAIILITLVTESIAIFYASSKDFPIPRYLLIMQVPLIIFILGFAYIKNRRIWQRKVEEYGINLREISKNSKTDLDALYTILKNKKEIKVRSISNIFKIEEDLAMEWSRILEAGELVTIEYPGFGSPKVIYIDKTKKPENTKDVSKKPKPKQGNVPVVKQKKQVKKNSNTKVKKKIKKSIKKSTKQKKK